MNILGYVLIIIALLLGSTTVRGFSWGKNHPASPPIIKKWYLRLLVFILAVAIGVLGGTMID